MFKKRIPKSYPAGFFKGEKPLYEKFRLEFIVGWNPASRGYFRKANILDFPGHRVSSYFPHDIQMQNAQFTSKLSVINCGNRNKIRQRDFHQNSGHVSKKKLLPAL